MKRVLLGLWLLGAAGVSACASPSRDHVQATEPLLAANASTRGDVVAVMATRGIEKQLCTGTLLLPNLVLTARHCLITDRSAIQSGDCATALVAEPDALTRVVVLPGADVDLVPEASQLAVREYLLPSDEARLCGQDLALLLLESPIDGDLLSISRTPPASIATFSAVGYGLFDGDWGQQRERSDAALVCAGSACADERIVENEFLARSGACEGDSGGPALDTDGHQFAIVSRSTADCSEAAYLGLSSYFDWLKAGVEYAAAQGTYELPRWAAATSTDEGGPLLIPTTGEPDMRARGGCSMSHAPRRGNGLPLLLLAALVLGRRKAR